MSAARVWPFVSIVVPVRNGEATIGDCLTAVIAAEYPAERREIVVVDNGSTDCTADVVRRFGVRYIREERRGAAHARNRGIRETEGEVLAFIDADCMVTKGWLREMVAPFSDARIAATAGELVAYPPTTGAERYMARRKPMWQRWASSARAPWFLIGNSAIRRAVFDRIGMLDPAFATVGCEDIDLSRRFFDAGLELRYCPRAVTLHRHRATARSLFVQQIRNGRGQSLIQYRYRSLLRWGWREELGAWRDLAAGGWRLTRALAARVPDGRRDELGDAYYDLLRKLAQRIGFVHGAVGWRITDAWRGLPARAAAPPTSALAGRADGTS